MTKHLSCRPVSSCHVWQIERVGHLYHAAVIRKLDRVTVEAKRFRLKRDALAWANATADKFDEARARSAGDCCPTRGY